MERGSTGAITERRNSHGRDEEQEAGDTQKEALRVLASTRPWATEAELEWCYEMQKGAAKVDPTFTPEWERGQP